MFNMIKEAFINTGKEIVKFAGTGKGKAAAGISLAAGAGLVLAKVFGKSDPKEETEPECENTEIPVEETEATEENEEVQKEEE